MSSQSVSQSGAGSNGRESPGDAGGGKRERRMYLLFGAMIATSTVTMFGLTYTNAYVAEHLRFSEERVYMALLMGAVMAIIMLSFMRAIVVGGAALALSRSQVWVDDDEYMKGMIPHHSIAVLTSERAQIDDVRVRELADEIILAQRREIAEMEWLIEDIHENGIVATEAEAAERPVPDSEVSLNP